MNQYIGKKLHKNESFKAIVLNFGYVNTKLTNTFFEKKNLRFIILTEIGKQ